MPFQRKIVTLQKRALRLIYFSKSKEHTVPFFLKSNCLPLPSLFFRDCSYLLYDINRQTAPVSILNHFVKTSRICIHNYRARSVSSDSFYVKFSRTDKMYAFFSRIGAQIWNSIPYSIKIKRLSFRKKIRVVVNISICRVNTTSRLGIKHLGVSFGSNFLLFSIKSSRGPHS